MVLVQKWAFSQLFFLSNIGQEKFFYDILDRTNAFLGYKKKEVQKVQKLSFSQPMVMVQKWPIYATFLF